MTQPKMLAVSILIAFVAVGAYASKKKLAVCHDDSDDDCIASVVSSGKLAAFDLKNAGLVYVYDSGFDVTWDCYGSGLFGGGSVGAVEKHGYSEISPPVDFHGWLWHVVSGEREYVLAVPDAVKKLLPDAFFSVGTAHEVERQDAGGGKPMHKHGWQSRPVMIFTMSDGEKTRFPIVEEGKAEKEDDPQWCSLIERLRKQGR